MDKEKMREEVISQLRGCLVSVKGRCDLRQISSDFKMLMGYPIPYSKLGYRTLEDFIHSISTISTANVNGQLYIDAKPTEKSSHISMMVDRQRATKKRSAPIRRRPPPQYRHSDFGNRSNPPRWRPKNLNNTYQNTTPRPVAVAHNQFVNRPTPSRMSNRLTMNPEIKKPLSAAEKENSNPYRPTTSSVKEYKVPAKPEIKTTKEPVNLQTRKVSVESTKYENGTSTTKLENGISKTDTATNLVKSARSRIMEMAQVKENGFKEEKAPRLFKMSLGDAVLLEESSVYTNHVTNFPLTRISDIIEKQKQTAAALNPTSDKLADVQKKTAAELNPIDDDDDTLVDLQKRTAPEFVPTGDALVDLRTFVDMKRLGELSIKVKPRKKLYDCCIKVQSHVFSSYPTDFQTQESAIQFTAGIALNELMEKYCDNELLISHDEVIADRILSIVKTHYHGVWETQLHEDYVAKYKEVLPVNWVEVVDYSPTIELVPCVNKYVVRYCKPGEVFQKGSSLPKTPHASYISVPSKTINFDNDILTGEVTCVASAGEIWCCQKETDESKLFMEMCIKMENYYNECNSQESTSDIEIGGYYVVFNNGVWCRVRVLEITENEVHCFCIDYGDECIVLKANIFKLHIDFAREAAQAFVCRLSGIEELYNISKSTDCLSNLLGKVYQVQLDNRSDNSGGSTPNDPALPVIFYDSENPEAPDSINESLATQISIETAKPVLNINTPTEVYVVHADDDGSVYVQIRSLGYDQLMNWLSELQEDILDNKLTSGCTKVSPQDSKDRLFFVVNKDDNVWYRAKINEWSPDFKLVQLLYVDFGKTAIVNVAETKFYPLDESNEIICKFAHQAVRVEMALNNNIPKNFVQQVLRLMPNNQSVLLKVVDHSAIGVALCDFFKRSETDNVLFSINAAMSMVDEFQNLSLNEGNSNSNGQSVKLKKLILLNQFDSLSKNVPSSGSLPSPPLPSNGSYFDIKVPCAVNPYNFFVQPYESNDKLIKLMTGLQESCKNIVYSPLHIEDILPGKIYASRNEDGKWYRTSVIKIIHAGSISVFYCDFGYYANLTLQQLAPLNIEFTSLPYQALKARLAGIEPKNSNWSMDDCKYFEKLVCRKSFVSILVSKETDDFYRYDSVLSLKLIDTSTAVDVCIEDILVQKGIAKYTNNKK